MDSCLSPATLKSCFPFPAAVSPRRPITRRPLIVVAGTCSDADRSLIAPLEPRSPAGRSLNRVLLDDRENLPTAARRELERLALRRDEAAARSESNFNSDEAFLHRRIAQLRLKECRVEVEDVIYALILHKFLEMRVHLVPRLSQCVCNNRLELVPRNDWELESIHSIEVLEMVREHVNSSTPARTVRESWATTQMQRAHLRNLYSASIFYGYFLKSASLRHALESHCKKNSTSTSTSTSLSKTLSLMSNYLGMGRNRVQGEGVNLRRYVMGFKQEAVERCARPRSVEGVDVVERHCCALFGDERIDTCVATSFASVKRLALEAVAFGCFLWDAEKCVDSVYKLEDNAVF